MTHTNLDHIHAVDPPAPTPRRWSDEHIAILNNGVKNGLGYPAIAKIIFEQTGISFTRKACESKFRSLGQPRAIPIVVWSKEADDFIRENVDKLSYRDIGARFGKTPSAVSGRVKRLGLANTSDNEKRIKSLRATLAQRRGDRPKPRPRLRVVDGGGGTQRTLWSVETDLPSLAVADVVPLNLTLADLPDNGCRYIAGEPTGACYCGHPQRAGSSLCKPHHQLCWLPPTERNAKARRVA